MKKVIIYLNVIISLVFLSLKSNAQTLIMNEVSNGPSGNMEYVEFVVIDSNITYNCAGMATAPCIDIRGWIFDDNSGYHGTSGIATGCIRFSNDPFWSCIPVGTIILIYNNLDPNSSLPPNDVSMSDGNCRLVVPVNNTTLFESNATTPGAAACSYPATGWTASGNWNNTLFANTGDCARIVNLAGCEVFSVCWGTDNLNTLIYFTGSAQDRVYFFDNSVNNNPTNAANWTNGCADPVACGSNVQTPGAPNNAANAAWINSFNNGCAPIPPIAAVGSFTNGGCAPCTGSASVSASGSIPPYTYTWSPTPGTGQGTSLAGGLCTGTYSCFVQSSIGCLDTIVVNVSSGGAFTGTVTATNIKCNGQSSASATVAITGGSTPYSYTWTPAPGAGQGTSTVSGLSAQVYSVTIKDAGGCSITLTTNITQPLPLATPVSSTNVLCNGNSTGSASVTVSGGTPGYTYTWSPSGGNSATATNLAAGNYTVLVKDANNCTVTAVANITQPPILIAPVTTSSILCFGGATGSASVAASGGAAGYTYTWSPSGGNSAIATNLTAGNYTVLVKDANSCTVTSVAAIQQPATALTAPVSTSSILCNGGTGSATVTAIGGTSGYTYTWTPSGGNSSVANSLTAGSYTIITKDANNCTVTTVANITQPTPLVAPVISTSVLCNGGSTGSATVNASGGTPNYTYTWSPSGGNSASASGLAAGNYSVLIKDANNCTVTAVTTISQPATALTTTIAATNAICGMTNGSATVTVAGGTSGYTYSWSPTGGASATATGLGAGNYSVLITDANNCTITAATIVNQPVSMSVTLNTSSVQCNGGNSGSATVSVSGGTLPYSYTWSPTPGGGQGTSIATGLTAQTYTVKIADNAGCSTVAIASILQPSPITTSITTSNVLCFGGSTGSATVSTSGGIPGYTYTWNPSGGNSSVANNLSAGTYMVLLADANNCTITAVANIAQPPVLTTMVNSNTVLCNGGSTGGATVTVNGGTGAYSYTWLPSGGNSSVAANFTAGSYTVVASDANNCITASVVNISQPSAITATINSTNASCGLSNGSATVSVNGGIAGYNYTWSPSGGNSSVASGLSAGNYSLSITDANNCTFSTTININQPSVITTSISSTSVTCFGGSNGTSTVLVSGGTGPYNYTWTPVPGGGQGTNAITGLTAQTYSVTITDALGCFTTTATNITQPLVLNAVVSSTNVLCNGSSNGSSSVTVNGGTGLYSYTWSPSGGNNSLANGLSAGNYTVMISDGNNCQLTATTAIIEPSPITTSLTVTNITCNGANDGSATVTVTGGTPGYTYTWNPSGGNSFSANNLSQGIYTVTIRDANNCTASSIFNISEPPALALINSQTNITCFGGNDGTAAILASGGTGPLTYSWQNTSSASSSATSLGVGSYTCIVTDSNKCSAITIINITQPTQVIATTSNFSVCSGSSVMVTSTVTGGSGPYAFNWDGGTITGQNIIVAPTQNTFYSLVVTDVFGCNSAAVTSSVTVFSQPTVSITGNDSICSGNNATISTNVFGATGTINYLWSPGSFTTSVITVTPAINTIYNVLINTTGMCPLSITKQVTVAVLPKPVVTVNSPLSGCAPLCVTYISNSSTATGSIVGWSWNFNNGSSSITQNPNICFESAGTYTGQHTVVNSFGCSTTINTGSITVYPKPVADFNHSPIKPIVNVDQDVTFTDASWGTPIVSWNWYFMNTPQYTSTEQNPNFIYTEAGTYVVALVVKSNLGCSDTLLRPIVVGEDFGLYVPNAFTPNDDGINDGFQPKGFGIVKYELFIFDRWGEKIFNTKTFEEAWPGTYQGRGNQICEEGVYTWLIEATDVFGKSHELNGHVTLLK